MRTVQTWMIWERTKRATAGQIVDIVKPLKADEARGFGHSGQIPSMFAFVRKCQQN